MLSACLLCDLTFHQVDGVFLELLSDLLLFSLPLRLKSVRAVALVLRNDIDGLFLAVLGHILQVKQGIVEDFEVRHLF